MKYIKEITCLAIAYLLPTMPYHNGFPFPFEANYVIDEKGEYFSFKNNFVVV